MDLFLEAVYLMLTNNEINIFILLGMVLVSIKKATPVLWVFILYYTGYLAADVSMYMIEISVAGGGIEDFQKTWHLLLAMLAAGVMLTMLIDGLFCGIDLVQVLTCVYIMLFYVVPNVGFAGFPTSNYDYLYNHYGSFRVLMDIALVALSLIKARGNECSRMVYNG